MTCPAIAIASSTSARNTKREEDLMRREGVVAYPREHGARHQEGRVQRGGSDEDLAADPRERPHPVERGPARVGRRGEQRPGERRRHARLRDDGRPRRPGEAPVEAVDEEQVQEHVRRVRDDHDHERRAQVGHAAQVALPGERDEREDQADRPDPQVRHRKLPGTAVPAHELDERHGEAGHQHSEADADRARQPQGLGGDAPGRLLLARAVQARHLSGRPVGQEVEERERPGEQRRGDGERRELLRPEVPDHRRVGEQVERLGRERAERRQREPEDLAVVRGAQRHARYSRTK
jgi:hypothetical protein